MITIIDTHIYRCARTHAQHSYDYSFILLRLPANTHSYSWTSKISNYFVWDVVILKCIRGMLVRCCLLYNRMIHRDQEHLLYSNRFSCGAQFNVNGRNWCTALLLYTSLIESSLFVLLRKTHSVKVIFSDFGLKKERIRAVINWWV